MRSRWWRVVVVVLVVAVAVGMYEYKASTRKNETEKDTSPLRSLMLTRQDIPDATDITWYETGRYQSNCPQADSIVHLAISWVPETHLTVERIETGSASVTEALVFNVIESSPGDQVRWLRDAVAECEGTTDTVYPWPDQPTPAPGQDTIVTITSLDPAGLPDGAFGFHQTATAQVETGPATTAIDTVYAPVMHDDQRGIIMVRTAVPDDGTPAPDITDLLTTALHRADATLDPAQLTPPAPSPTTSPTP